MVVICSSPTNIPPFSVKPPKTLHLKFPNFPIFHDSKDTTQLKLKLIALPSFASAISLRTRATSVPSSATTPTFANISGENRRHWMVLMEPPPSGFTTKSQVVDYYVNTLQKVLGSEDDAQMRIYHTSCNTHFGFCCDIDEVTARELAGSPGVLSVRPDPDFGSVEKDYSYSKDELNSQTSYNCGNTLLFPAGTSKYWLVQMSRPAIGVIRKAQVVDYYVQVLTKVLGNEKDAQMCIYHISWQSDYGFCCELDETCARELESVAGVLSVRPDENFGSDHKNYRGEKLEQVGLSEDSTASSPTANIKTKKLFVTGLSFYTSEKTLRAAFEGFGELIEVKIIMDKISKRSKGYAFVEYTTEEAASTALREMNGKIINGWMITVDVAKKNPPKYGRGHPRPVS